MLPRYHWTRRFHDDQAVHADRFVGRTHHQAHDHEYVELVLITGGTGLHRGSAGDLRLRRGLVVLLRPGCWHEYIDGRDLGLWDCCFPPGLLGRELAWLIDDPALNRLLWSGPLAAKAHGQVDVLLPEPVVVEAERLLAAIQTSGGAGRVAQIALLVQLLALTAGHLGSEVRPARPVHPAVAAVVRMFEDAPSQPWTLGGLALRTATTPTYLARVFRAATGLPPLAYLHRRRCELAARLLQRTERPVGAIGAEVGWPDANHFARRFRDHFGITATAYRQRFVGV